MIILMMVMFLYGPRSSRFFDKIMWNYVYNVSISLVRFLREAEYCNILCYSSSCIFDLRNTCNRLKT